MNTVFTSRQVSDKLLAYPQIGFIKQVEDKKRYGRIKVWIPAFETKENDPTGWITCQYCTPFGGATNWENNSKNLTDTFEDTQTSYGFWAVPPDLNNEVIVMFPGGDISKAIWVGCLYKEYMTAMVPASQASAKNKNKKNKKLPVAEFNKHDRKSGDANNPIDPIRPWNKPKAFGIGNQGLIKDTVRGIISSSSQEDNISTAYGMSTPGPIEAGKKNRLSGHSFVMDDDPTNEYIGFTTRSGAKVLINETYGFLYMINKRGTGWLQIDDDGNIDMYGAGSISLRAEDDVNIRADRNIIFEAGKDFYLKASKDFVGKGNIGKENEGSGGNIFIQSLASTTINSKEKIIVSTESDVVVKIDGTYSTHAAGNISVSTDANLNIKSANYQLTNAGAIKISSTLHAGGAISSGGDISSSQQSLNSLFNHTHAGVMSGGSSTAPFGAGGSATNATASQSTVEVAPIKSLNSKVNITGKFNNTTAISYGGKSIEIPDWWNPEKKDINTITDRFVTHEPYNEHKVKKE
jgi:phage baseplate assembly protein gpV